MPQVVDGSPMQCLTATSGNGCSSRGTDAKTYTPCNSTSNAFLQLRYTSQQAASAAADQKQQQAAATNASLTAVASGLAAGASANQNSLASMTAALAGNSVSNANSNAFDAATTAGTEVPDVPAPEGPCSHTWKNLYYAGMSYDALLADPPSFPTPASSFRS